MSEVGGVVVSDGAAGVVVSDGVVVSEGAIVLSAAGGVVVVSVVVEVSVVVVVVFVGVLFVSVAVPDTAVVSEAGVVSSVLDFCWQAVTPIMQSPASVANNIFLRICDPFFQS